MNKHSGDVASVTGIHAPFRIWRFGQAMMGVDDSV